MTRSVISVVRRPDPILLGLYLALAAVGLVAISSAGIEYGYKNFDSPWHLAVRHGFYLAIAALAASLAYRVPVSMWHQTSAWWLLGAIGLLLLVLIPGIGREVNGSQRWLPLGPVSVQPSEIVKFAMVLYTAGYLVRHAEAVRQHWLGLAKPIGILGLLALLLLAEPDFGATVIVFGTVFGMLFLAGARLLYVLSLVGVAIGGVVAMVLAAPYRLRRLEAYQNPWEDPFGDGYQVIQSLIAYGRGELTGVGLGNSIQKLSYLPEAHTDFVFSVWAEETGFVGAVIVIGLFCALVARIFQVALHAMKADEYFAAYVCFGAGLIISGQAFVNIGVSSGLLPTKGLTLPLVSYGGSSLVVTAIMLAVVLRIERTIPPGAGGAP